VWPLTSMQSSDPRLKIRQAPTPSKSCFATSALSRANACSVYTLSPSSLKNALNDVNKFSHFLRTSLSSIHILHSCSNLRANAFSCSFWGQRPLVPLLLLGPPFFLNILLVSTTLLTRSQSYECDRIYNAQRFKNLQHYE
jgi:hypothetical protein